MPPPAGLAGPWHRLAKHNGVHAGGVPRLAPNRPWRIAAWVSGFHDHRMAMAFEAAWQKGFTAACMAHTARFRVASGVRGKC